MPNVLFTDVAAILSKAQLVITGLQAANLPIPGAVTDLVTKANSMLETWPQFQAPDSFQADLQDLANLAAYLEPLLGKTHQAANLNSIVQNIQGSAASAANLADGQLAVWGKISASFNGQPDDIIVGAWRAGGAFADLVNDGQPPEPLPTPPVASKAAKKAR